MDRRLEPTLPVFRSVLVVCAHPDDESFGLGAVIATLVGRGTAVDTLCLTRGEASTLGADRADVADLADARAEELCAAAGVLGLRQVEQRGYPDGELASVPRGQLASEVRRLARGHDAFLVFDDGGITGHRDHQAATDAALIVARELGLPVLAWAVPQRVADCLNAEFGSAFVGRADEELDLRFAVDRMRQRQAIACHASQSEVNPVVWRRLELTGDRETLRYLAPCSSTNTEQAPAREVVIPRDVLDAIVEDCRTSYPSEVCGLIGGTPSTLQRVLPVPNVAEPLPGQCGFAMDSKAQLYAMRKIEDGGLELAGIYHSHPHGAPVPSEGDIRLAAYPDVAYLIVSTFEPAAPELRAWHIEGGHVEELHLRVTGR